MPRKHPTSQESPSTANDQTSRELRLVFTRHLDNWTKKKRSSQEELARLCGVTPSYISQISRYGRIPSKPVLILLGLHLELDDPGELFRAAKIDESWPIEKGMRLSNSPEQNGFLSLKLDMNGFTQAIREIVRGEVKPRTIGELTRGAPLRFGFNRYQRWYFDQELSSKSELPLGGAFPDMLALLSTALRNEMKTEDIIFSDSFERLKSGTLDAYGPIFSTPERFGHALYTTPFCRVGVSALWRKGDTPLLKKLPVPRSIQELREGDYVIAVLRDAMSHHFALTDLGKKEKDLVICDSPDETTERLLLSSIPRPAHINIMDSFTSYVIEQKHKKQVERLFCSKNNVLGWLDDVIAVRPDWPELLQILNDTLKYGSRSGAIQKLILDSLPKELHDVVEIPN